MENDKLFDLMSKMYGEMQNGFKSVNNRLDKLETRMDNFEVRMDSLEKNQVKLENEVHEGFKTLYDGYIQNAESITRIEAKVDCIYDRVNKNEIELKVLQKSKMYRG